MSNLDGANEFIKLLKKEIKELESYKKDWQEIAGKANLKHLIAKNGELEKKLAEANNLRIELQGKYSEETNKRNELESIVENLEDKIEKIELAAYFNNDN